MSYAEKHFGGNRKWKVVLQSGTTLTVEAPSSSLARGIVKSRIRNPHIKSVTEIK